MAHYNIHYRCDHEERIELFGKEVDRQKRIKWLESGVCKNCWKREKITEEQLKICNNDESLIPTLIKSKYWNFKYYTENKNVVYINDERYELNEEEMLELQNWTILVRDYLDKIKGTKEYENFRYHK